MYMYNIYVLAKKLDASIRGFALVSTEINA